MCHYMMPERDRRDGCALDGRYASEAFALFQNYVELEKAARESYVEQHGPLTQNDAALNSTYTWGNGPWPWQYSEEEA